MSDDSSSSASSSPPQARRRSSFAGQTFADLFGTSGASAHRGSISRAMSEYPPQQGPQYPNPITSAAAQAQRRRLSVTTLGLSGSPNQTSPFNSFRGRRDSDGGSLDESAVEDEVVSGGGGANPTPQTPLGRRMSFGARALRDVRTGGANGGGGTSPGQNGNNRPSATSAANAASPNNNNSSTISSRGDYAKGRGLSPAALALMRPLHGFSSPLPFCTASFFLPPQCLNNYANDVFS